MVKKVKIGVDLDDVVILYVDSDLARCGRTTKSTNRGCILMKDLVHHTVGYCQVPGEAKYHAVKGQRSGWRSSQ